MPDRFIFFTILQPSDQDTDCRHLLPGFLSPLNTLICSLFLSFNEDKTIQERKYFILQWTCCSTPLLPTIHFQHAGSLTSFSAFIQSYPSPGNEHRNVSLMELDGEYWPLSYRPDYQDKSNFRYHYPYLNSVWGWWDGKAVKRAWVQSLQPMG